MFLKTLLINLVLISMLSAQWLDFETEEMFQNGLLNGHSAHIHDTHGYAQAHTWPEFDDNVYDPTSEMSYDEQMEAFRDQSARQKALNAPW